MSLKNPQNKTLIMKSIYEKIGTLEKFPEFKGRDVLYMHKASIRNPLLPKEFQDFSKPIKNILGHLVNQKGVCYITIDEKTVCNDTHRRAGVHVDFNWHENEGWDNPRPPSWKSPVSLGDHKPIVPKPGVPAHDWNLEGFLGKHGHRFKPEEGGGMLLVSNYPGCKAYRGSFSGDIGEGGDCTTIDLSGLESTLMAPGEIYYLNALGIHEPLVIKEKVNRTLIRINLHPEYLFLN